MSMYQLSGSIKPTLASDDNQVVQWPILFLYDEVSQSDFVESYDERNELVDQMQLMFPADRPVDWDEDGKYSWDRLVAYLEFYPESSGATKMLKMKMEEPLQACLQSRSVPPVLVFHVLVEGTPANENFCQSNEIVCQ